MVQLAPQVSARIVDLIVELDDGSRSIADICRAAGHAAVRLDKPRPSYETVRAIVHRHRRRGRGPSLGEVAVDVAFRLRPPEAILDHVSGVGVPDL